MELGTLSRAFAVMTATHARRIAVTAVPVLAAAGMLLSGIAQGTVPVSFSVSGGQFQISAEQLYGTGLSQYAGVAVDARGEEQMVTVANIKSATIRDLCQSAVADLPFGTVGIVIRAGRDGHPANASDLQISMSGLSGEVAFGGARIGVDASQVDTEAKGGAGDFGIDAETVSIAGLQQTAWSTQASVLRLNGMSLELTGGEQGCF